MLSRRRYTGYCVVVLCLLAYGSAAVRLARAGF